MTVNSAKKSKTNARMSIASMVIALKASVNVIRRFCFVRKSPSVKIWFAKMAAPALMSSKAKREQLVDVFVRLVLREQDAKLQFFAAAWICFIHAA